MVDLLGIPSLSHGIVVPWFLWHKLLWGDWELGVQ